MRIDSATTIIEGLYEAGVDLVAVMPDSKFVDVQRMLSDDKRFTYVPVSNESIGVGICGGSWLGGKKPALLVPTAGLLVAAWPLTSLCMAYGIPLLLLIPYRGDVGDDFWYMGPYKFTTEPLMNILQISYTVVNKISEVKSAIQKAQASTMCWLRPVSILLTGETVW